MEIEICINLGDYENIKIRSSNYSQDKWCAKEIIQTLSKINMARADSFIQEILLPIFYDGPRKIERKELNGLIRIGGIFIE